MHSHNLYEIILFVKGDATHIIENRKYKLLKNDLILISPSKYHFIEVESDKPYERFDILFNPDAFGLTNLNVFKTDYEVINLNSNPIALEIFYKLDYYSEKLPNKQFNEVATLLIKELFYNLSAFKSVNEKEYSTLTPIISKALTYINDNLFTLTSINEVAEKLYVTPSYLFRLFKNELKTSPKKYLDNKRLLYAQNMIIKGKNPTTVAISCGWSDYTAFYRSYVKFFGYSPSKEKVKTSI
jgi:AraC-like DNA-binding protein